MANKVFIAPDYQDDRFSLKEIKSIHQLQGKFKKHFHEDYSIAIVTRGSTIAWFDGAEYRIEEGEIVLIPQCVVHACNPQAQDNWSYWLITVKPSWLRLAFKDTPWIDKLFAGPCMVTKATPAARRCFAKLTSMPLLPEAANETENLLVELITSIIDTVVYAEEQHRQPVESPSIEYAANYLREHYEHDVSLDELSYVTGLSKYSLVRSFASYYNLTPHAYLINVRINTAKELLQKGDTIVDTSIKSGFYDQSHFTRTFQRYVGMTPSAYKRSC